MREKVRIFNPSSLGLQLSYDEAIAVYLALKQYVAVHGDAEETKRRSETIDRVVSRLGSSVQRGINVWP